MRSRAEAGSSCLTRARPSRVTAAVGCHGRFPRDLSAARLPPKRSPAHRGRRSVAASLRRLTAWDKRQANTLHENLSASRIPVVHGDSDVLTSPTGAGQGNSWRPPAEDIVSAFRIFHLNVNGFDVHAHFLESVLFLHQYPEFVALTETHLRPVVVQDIELSGYKIVSRRDRPVCRGPSGGVALFARADVHSNIVSISSSNEIEAIWHTIHCDIGPILLGVWYRRPDPGEVCSVQSFDHELELHSAGHIATVIVGDMNCHHEEWLTHSHGTTREGKLLEQVAASHGLKQKVRQPTRGQYLLDLVLTDLQSLSCIVVPGVLENDHRATIASVAITIPRSTVPARECFDIGKARWSALQRELEKCDWGALLGDLDADAAAAVLRDRIVNAASRFIPRKTVKERPFEHAWVDATCHELLARKHRAEGTPEYAEARDACTDGFRLAHAKYVAETRRVLKTATCKDWWNTSKQLLGQSQMKAGIPPLQHASGWAKTPSEKATLLAETFTAKSTLPPQQTNEFTELCPNESSLAGFLRIRVRTVLRILKLLDEKSGTGPDGLPSIILRRCAAQLALPTTLLARKCLNEGRWPMCWRNHWIHPLHKRSSKANPRHYRGVHLTAQLSKVVERAVGSAFLPWMHENTFGPHQYAYAAKKSHRDVLAVNVCSWLLLFEEGRSIGLYCSDVSGAFDRVAKDRICDKIRVSGLPPKVVKFLESWLEDRVSNVVVSGFESIDEVLANSVFQGTVLGPALWNLFYSDAN